MRIYFGGTFDPVHKGHVQLAEELAAYFDQNQIYLMPCFKAVHKNQVMASPEQRLTMLQLAIEGRPNLFVDMRELQHDSPSYTFNSLSDIRREIGDESLAFVIGTDALISFPLWYRSEQLSELAHLIVIERPIASFRFDNTASLPCDTVNRQHIEKVLDLGFKEVTDPSLLEKNTNGLLISLKLSQLAVSSSEVRRRVRENKPINHLVGAKVADYIKHSNLYQNQEA